MCLAFSNMVVSIVGGGGMPTCVGVEGFHPLCWVQVCGKQGQKADISSEADLGGFTIWRKCVGVCSQSERYAGVCLVLVS